MALFGTKKPRLQAKVLPKFPVQIEGTGGFAVDKANGVYTFSPDLNSLPEITEETGTGYVWHFDGDQTYSKISVGLLVGQKGDKGDQGEQGPPGDMVGPDTTTNGYVPVWNGTDGTTLAAGFQVSAFSQATLAAAYNAYAFAKAIGMRSWQNETYHFAENVDYIPRVDPNVSAKGTVGSTLGYGEWWTTATSIARWTKPDSPFFLEATFDVVSGGGGGGTSAGADGTASTGGGGGGGAFAQKKILAEDITDTLVFIVGHGGTAGGWNVTPVVAPGPPTFVAGQGCIFKDGTGNFNGTDGGHSAILTETAWNGLGANDSARLAAFYALADSSWDDAAAICIVFCGGGGLGRAAWTADYEGGSASNAFGGDINRDGSAGGGGGIAFVDGDTSSKGYDEGFGSGGTAGGAAQNDGLWENFNRPASGYIGQLCGAGASWKHAVGNHDGSHGALFGGGGGGGQTTAPQLNSGNPRVIIGGFGAPGVIRVIEAYDLT